MAARDREWERQGDSARQLAVAQWHASAFVAWQVTQTLVQLHGGRPIEAFERYLRAFGLDRLGGPEPET